MSLAINPDKVTDVLLADGWHHVTSVGICLDAYEFVVGSAQHPRFEGGGLGAQWAEFERGTETDVFVSVPFTSILAVKQEEL